jgi:hypothetical protein
MESNSKTSMSHPITEANLLAAGYKQRQIPLDSLDTPSNHEEPSPYPGDRHEDPSSLSSDEIEKHLRTLKAIARSYPPVTAKELEEKNLRKRNRN